MGDEKYTFIEGVKNPLSCTILIKGPNDHTIAIVKVFLLFNLLIISRMLSEMDCVPLKMFMMIIALFQEQELSKLLHTIPFKNSKMKFQEKLSLELKLLLSLSLSFPKLLQQILDSTFKMLHSSLSMKLERRSMSLLELMSSNVITSSVLNLKEYMTIIALKNSS
jgi:hypothetical protein